MRDDVEHIEIYNKISEETGIDVTIVRETIQFYRKRLSSYIISFKGKFPDGFRYKLQSLGSFYKSKKQKNVQYAKSNIKE